MATNPLPDAQAKLWSLAADMSDGFQAHDPDFLHLPVEDDLDLLLENLPTNGVLKFYVTATNPAGDSPKSEVVSITLS